LFEAVVEQNLSRQDLQEHIERHFNRHSFGKLVLSDACALRPTSMGKPAVRPGRGTREAMRQTGAGACGDRINTQSGVSSSRMGKRTRSLQRISWRIAGWIAQPISVSS
jgi:hypothetical protein